MPSIATEHELEARLLTTGAIREGHFVLSSGLHSARYVQCARLLQHPDQAEWACRQLAARLAEPVDVVVGPALGGVIVAYELARALGVRAVFTERVEGRMRLRRGFAFSPGERALICEDVVTTGKSALEAAAEVQAEGARVVAYASLVDRSCGGHPFELPFYSLLAVEVATHAPAECPLCVRGLATEKPGSRT